MVTEKKGLYIFEGLTEKEIAYFMMMSQKLTFPQGATILSEGEVSNNQAYLIESGTVDVLRKGFKVSTLDVGDIFGELALITNERRSAQIVAASELEVLAFDREEFLMLYKQSHLYEEMQKKILMRVKDNFYNDKND
jgi:CRP-like cAMP-binding protein